MSDSTGTPARPPRELSLPRLEPVAAEALGRPELLALADDRPPRAPRGPPI